MYMISMMMMYMIAMMMMYMTVMKMIVIIEMIVMMMISGLGRKEFLYPFILQPFPLSTSFNDSGLFFHTPIQVMINNINPRWFKSISSLSTTYIYLR